MARVDVGIQKNWSISKPKEPKHTGQAEFIIIDGLPRSRPTTVTDVAKQTEIVATDMAQMMLIYFMLQL